MTFILNGVTASPLALHDLLTAVGRFVRPTDEELLTLSGWGTWVHTSEEGDVLGFGRFSNLITDTGDTYYAAQAVVGVAPAGHTAPTLVTGMKLGTGTTAVSKNGAGAALVTYNTALTANKVFDATFPTSASLGGGLGAQVGYQVTWGAGLSTQSGIAEVVIVTDAAVDATSIASATICRALLSPTVNKGPSDTLAVTWTHKFLGA